MASRFLFKSALTLVLSIPLLMSHWGTLPALASTSLSAYETVNIEPQFSTSPETFYFYWGVWRTLSPTERSALQTHGGHLYSHRKIHWRVIDCKTGVLSRDAGENFWFWDQVGLDSEGRLIPIREAQRPDYLYFSLLNLNAWNLRGTPPFVAPRREAGEVSDHLYERTKVTYEAWKKSASPAGTRGTLVVKATHRLSDHRVTPKSSDFFSIDDYTQGKSNLSPELSAQLDGYHPARWPIHYDERAHKPHHLREPELWRNTQSTISESKFAMKLEWDGCVDRAPITVTVRIPKNGMPAPGPNRPGRDDRGTHEIELTEVTSEEVEGWD